MYQGFLKFIIGSAVGAAHIAITAMAEGATWNDSYLFLEEQFLGKFLVFKVAFETQQFFLIALGILTVGCGFYFYLKVVKAMYWQPVPADSTPIAVSRLSLVAMWVMVVLIFALGIFPGVAVGLMPSAAR